MKRLFFFCLLVALCSVAKAEEGSQKIALIGIQGGINPASEEFITRSIRRAREEGMHALVITLNTPGGLLTSTRKIVSAIFESEIPVVVYVSPGGAHAGSAGVMITLAAHVAAMAPGTNIGAAHPVTGSGGDIEGDLAEKVTSDAAAFARSIAETRDRNVEWAVDAVKSSVSITDKQALEKKVIDVVAPDLRALLTEMHGRKIWLNKEKTVELQTRGALLFPYEMNWKQKFIDTLSDPNIAYILMMIGAVGIYMELSHPGVLFPGIVGGISLILAFVSMQTLPINYGGLALLLLGLGLLLAEIFVPSFGILGISGLISLGLGSFFLIDEPVTGMRLSMELVAPTLILVGLISFGMSYLVFTARRRKVSSGREALIGELAEVAQILEGGVLKVTIRGEYWNAVCEDRAMRPGDKVRVIAIEGMILNVRRD